MKKIVYIMGAGSSKDLGLPLGNEIYDFGYRISSLNSSGLCKDLRSAILQVESFLKAIFVNLPADKRSYPPFEEVLTLIWDTKRTERYDDDAHRLISVFDAERGADQVLSYFVRMLWMTILGSMLHDLPCNDIVPFSTYIKSLDFKNCDISFISLNYDVILDRILSDCVSAGIIQDFTYGVQVADAFTQVDGPRREPLRSEGVLLLKPHGSLNLVHCSQHKQAKYGEGYFCVFRNLDSVDFDNIMLPWLQQQDQAADNTASL